jgi:hypothetical protein
VIRSTRVGSLRNRCRPAQEIGPDSRDTYEFQENLVHVPESANVSETARGLRSEKSPLNKKKAECPFRASAQAFEKAIANLNQRSEPAAAAAEAAAASAGTIGPGTRLVDRQIPALHVLAVRGAKQTRRCEPSETMSPLFAPLPIPTWRAGSDTVIFP